MDLAIARWIYSIFGNSKFFAIASRIVTTLGSKWIIIAIVLVLIAIKKTRKLGVFALIAVGSAYVFNDFILKLIIKRDRPFVVDSNLIGICNLAGYELPDGYSMASGHTTAAICLAVMIFMFNKKWGIISIIIAFFVGMSRVCLLVHFFTDVLVGMVLGIVFAIGMYYLLNFILKKYLEKKGNVNGNNSSSNNKQA